MFVRTNKNFKEIMNSFTHHNPLILYSMWEGYLEKKEIKDFIDDFEVQTLHTSGHADVDSLKLIVDATNPKTIIPIHTTMPQQFPGKHVVMLNDKEEYTI